MTDESQYAGRGSPDDRTRLSWWFPRLPSDILVPKTRIYCYTRGFDDLCNWITQAGDQLGWPFFLRTDYLSGKHHWKDTCHVRASSDVPKHVGRLVEESEMADMLGFPTDVWVAREFIRTIPAFMAFRGNMPIVKERRYFVQDGQVTCHHPYWPPGAFDDSPVSVGNWRKRLDEMNEESDEEVRRLSELSSKVGAAIGGAWSIDWLWSQIKHEWYLTDMAEAAKSYHWPGCAAAPAGE